MQVPNEYLPLPCDRRVTNHCYREAYVYTMDHAEIPGILLVHGKYTKVPRGHAWVELPGGIIFDGVKRKFYRWSEYRRRFQAEARVKYTPRQAATFYIKKESSGPWEKAGWNGLYLGHFGSRMPGCLTPMWGFGSKSFRRQVRETWLAGRPDFAHIFSPL